jgi:RHS repeat-associated protein
MKQIFILFLFFINLFNSLEAIASKENPQSSSSEILNTSIIYESVNVITGEYCEAQTDLTTEGPFPLKVRRCYTQNSLNSTWQFNLPNLPSINTSELHEEAFANHKLLYFYDSQKRLIEVKTTDLSGKIIYNWLHISYPTDSTCEIITNEGNQICYHFSTQEMNRFESNQILSQVAGAYRNKTTYSYCTHPTERRQLITKKDNGEGHYQLIEYYEEPKSKKATPQHRNFSTGRVKELKGPVGTTSEPITTSRFIYSNGYTEVYDALGNKTIYRYTNTNFLDSIENYDSDGNLYRLERFRWDKNNGLNYYTLSSRSLENSAGNIEVSETFLYDLHGNTIKKTLKGNLIGSGQGTESYSTVYRYSEEAPFQLMLKKEDNGKSTRYEYDSKKDHLKKEFQYIANQLITRTFYEYNEQGLMTSITVDDGIHEDQNDLTGVHERHITRFTLRTEHPGIGLPEFIEEKYYDLEKGKEIFLKRVVNHYSQQNKIIQQDIYDSKNIFCFSISSEFDEFGRNSSTTDENGNYFGHSFDSFNNKIKEVIKTKKDSQEISFSYDFSNRLIRKEEKTEGKIEISQYVYDILGNQIVVIDDCGNETKYEYDAFGRLIKTIFPKILDGEDQSFHPIFLKEYDICNRIISVTDPNGFVKKMDYNARGNPTAIHYPDGSKESFLYNHDGSLAKSTGRNGLVSSHEIDPLTQMKNETVSTSTGIILKNQCTKFDSFHPKSIYTHSQITEYSYDFAGRQRSIITKNISNGEILKKNEFDYDKLGNLISTREWFDSYPNNYISKIIERDPQGKIIGNRIEDSSGLILRQESSKILAEIPSQQSTESHYVNSIGQFVVQKVSTDSYGISTHTLKNALGNIDSIYVKNSLGKIISKQEFRYDGVGNKIQEINFLFDNGQPEKQIINVWKYGPCNRIEEIIEGFRSPLQRRTAYKYINSGKLDHIQKPDGNLIYYQYDEMGNIAEYFSSDNSFHYQYIYDENGNLHIIRNLLEATFTERIYNSENLLMKETLENGFTISSAYDMLGRRIQLTLPDGSSVKYGHDAANLKKVIRFDSSNKKNYEHSYTEYGLDGLLLSAEMIANLGSINYERNPNKQIKSINTQYWSETICKNENGLTSSITTTDPLGTYINNYTHDEKNQLQDEIGQFEHAYTYDSLQNRISKNDSRYIVDDLHQLVSSEDADFIYDLNGNLIKKTVGKIETFYSYDALDRLIKIINNEFQIEYTYDPFGRRTSKKIYDFTAQKLKRQNFIFDGDKEIGSTNDNNIVNELRILGLGSHAEIGAAIALELNGETYAPINDHRGSVCSLVNAQTAQTEEFYRYSAFGERKTYNLRGHQKNSSLDNPWGFCSKRTEGETGLIYFGMRYYDPAIGRWITKDPLGFIDGSNRYLYVGNNPFSRLDAHGLFSFSEAWDSIFSITKNFFNLFSTPLCIIDSIREKFSLSKHLQADIDTLGIKFLGKYYLQFAGYFVDKEEVGVYGNGEVNDKVRVTLINGIMNARYDAIAALEHISNAHGGINVHYIFRPTDGWTWDLIKSIAVKAGFISSHAKKLAQKWKDLIQEMGGVDGGGLIIHYAHSLGAKDTYAATALLTPEELQMIRVITLGSPSLLKDNKFESVTNYVSVRDGVSYFDPIGYIKALLGKQENVNFIGSWLGIPFIDHYVGSPTYKALIEKLGTQFTELYGSL